MMTTKPIALAARPAASPGTSAAGTDVPSAQLVDKSVIHDLRNPLSAMGGNLQLLQAALETTLDEKNRGRLAACMASLDELTGMLTDLQYLTLLQAGELEPARKLTDVRALVAAALRVLAPRAAAEGRDIALGPGPMPFVSTTVTLMQRAIHNLVVSALRVSKASPVTIEISEEPGQFVEVAVSYLGVCVPAPLSNHLFDLDCPHLQRQHGLRIDRARGLHFAQVAARMHGGSVRYEPLEGGGRFVLRLPHENRQP